jgi:hypothetical protein
LIKEGAMVRGVGRADLLRACDDETIGAHFHPAAPGASRLVSRLNIPATA